VLVFSPLVVEEELPYRPKWVKQPADRAQVPIEVRHEESRGQRKAADATSRWAVVDESAARLGIVCPNTLKVLLRLAQRCEGPAAREMIDILEAMVSPPKRGAPKADQINVGYAFLMEEERQKLQDQGHRRYDILQRAAVNAIKRVEASNSSEKPPGVRRLLEIYRKHKSTVEAKWPDFQFYNRAEKWT
jgi:hypothetical protein